jgi:hypothetical protein
MGMSRAFSRDIPIELLDKLLGAAYTPNRVTSEDGMAGSKPNDTEKSGILDMVKSNYRIEEIQQKYPHIDGRVISGMHMRHNRRIPSPESTANPPPPGGAASAPAPASSPYIPPGTPQEDAINSTGFTPASTTVHTPQGFKPGYREYFVVKKIDPPNDGIMKTEYPPFGIHELMDRYAAGDYEVQHYREGRLFNTYREKIAAKGTSSLGTSGVQREQQKQESPVDQMVKTIDIYHKIHTEGRQDATVARREEAVAKSEEIRAKAQVETAATTGLIDLIKEFGKPKPTGNEGAVDRIFALMQEDRKTLETKMKVEMEMMRERAKIDLEFERERVKGAQVAAKADAEERIARERLFMTKMQELDADRQALWKESYDKMTTELHGMQEGLSRELDEKKKWFDQHFEMQKKYTDELIAIKKSAGTGADSLKIAEIVKDGFVQGLDRVGARIDMMVDKGVIPGQVKNPGDQKRIGNGETSTSTPSSSTVAKEEKAVLTKEAIQKALNEPWFIDLQGEIARTVKKRKAAQNPLQKPHGTLLGQAFIDNMNEDVSLRKYMHFLISRNWQEILEEVGSGFKPEYAETMKDPEAELWFNEFQLFLSAAWNASIGVK